MDKINLQELIGDNEKGQYSADSSKQSFNTRVSFPSITIKDGALHLGDALLGTEITVVLLAERPRNGVERAFFLESFKGAGQPPACSSRDGVTPSVHSPVATTCRICPKAKFGSGANGKGFACRSSKRLFLAISGEESYAASIRLSGRSLRNLDNYLLQFQENGFAVSRFYTTLTLEQNGEFWAVTFAADSAVDQEDFKTIDDLVVVASAEAHLS